MYPALQRRLNCVCVHIYLLRENVKRSRTLHSEKLLTRTPHQIFQTVYTTSYICISVRIRKRA